MRFIHFNNNNNNYYYYYYYYYYYFCLNSLATFVCVKERDRLKDLSIEGRILSKWILNNSVGGPKLDLSGPRWKSMFSENSLPLFHGNVFIITPNSGKSSMHPFSWLSTEITLKMQPASASELSVNVPNSRHDDWHRCLVSCLCRHAQQHLWHIRVKLCNKQSVRTESRLQIIEQLVYRLTRILCRDIHTIPLILYSGVKEDFIRRKMAAVPDPELLRDWGLLLRH